MYFVFNNHPLISILCAHHLNPFSKKKRIVVFVCAMCFTFAITFVLTVAYFINEVSLQISFGVDTSMVGMLIQVATCREGCDVQTVTGSDGSSSQVCEGGVNDGMSYSKLLPTMLRYLWSL